MDFSVWKKWRSRFVSWPHQTALSRKARMESLESRQFLSTSWFVSPTGSNQNPGTLAAPFQTIQAAANLAQPGDHVEIEAGTYHETVVPKHSGGAGNPIVYEAYNNENVTISGADPITNWTPSTVGNGLYQAPMSWDLGQGNNQVFVDGVAINEARWPSTSLDLLHPTLATASSVWQRGNAVTIFNAALTQPANYWKGAIVYILPGQAWVAETATVLSSAPGQFTFNFIPTPTYAKYTYPVAGNRFYLTGLSKTLSGSGQWYRDPSTGTLYLSTPAGDDPNTHDIEVKHRDFAFDLSHVAYTTIQGINIFSASVMTTTNSVGTILNNLHAAYVGQFVNLPKLWFPPANIGIQLDGANSVLENSVIAYSAGDGVFVYGSNCRITNNLIHDVDYSGTDAAAIRVYGGGVQVSHNTIYNTGRDGIIIGRPGAQVTYNTLHDIGLTVTEAGAIYTVGINGGGSVFAYNTIYNLHGGGYGTKALFLDNNSSNFVVHDNNAYNVDVGIGLNGDSAFNRVYNNTLSASEFSVACYPGSRWPGTTLANNLLLGPTHFGAGGTLKTNVTTNAFGGAGAATFTSGVSADIIDEPVGAPPAATPPPTTTTSGTSSPAFRIVAPPPDTGTPTPTTPPPAVIPATIAPAAGANTSASLAQLSAQVLADRQAILEAIKARKVLLAQLATTVRADLASYHAASHHLATTRRKETQNSGDAAALSALAAQLLQQFEMDRGTLELNHHSDFTGILAARQNLLADVKLLRAAKH